MLIVCPWMVTVADRGVVPVWGAAVKVAVPLPVPLPTLIVSQPALLVAVHAQPLPDATVALPVPPAAAKE
jgi:hypothetical protein